jgi:hypothetical protein
MKPFNRKAFEQKMREQGFRVGFADRRKTPHSVRCESLSRTVLGDELFEIEFNRRRWWCKRECQLAWDAVPILDLNDQLVGREFLFEDADEAMMFNLKFG